MRTILVTGSNGLIGSTVVGHFNDLGNGNDICIDASATVVNSCDSLRRS